MRAALRDAGGGNDGHLRGLLQLFYGHRAAVAHRGAHFVEAPFHIVFEAARIGDVTVHSFLEGQPRLSAEVVTLPVARAVAALAPIFLDVIAVDVELVGRALVETGEISAQHQEIRAHRKRKCHMIVVHDAAVRADGDVNARLFVILVSGFRDLDERARLPAAYAFLFARYANRTAAYAHFDEIRSAFGKEKEAVAVHDVASADFD